MTDGRPSRGPSFDLRHLRYFVALAEEGNFGRAAERLGIAQPGLSQQIAALENLVGTRLLDRRNRSFALTLAGRVFLDEAYKTLAQADAAFAAIRKLSRGEIGRVSIGYATSVIFGGLLADVIGGFRAAFPGIELTLDELTVQTQVDRVLEGVLDVAFIRPPASIPAGLRTITMQSEGMAVLLPVFHRLAGAAEIRLEELGNETFIVPNAEEEIGIHSLTKTACSAAGISPSIRPDARGFMTVASMVAVGMGIAVVPQSMECVRLPGVVYLPLAAPHIVTVVMVVFRQNETAQATNYLIEHCRRVANLSPA